MADGEILTQLRLLPGLTQPVLVSLKFQLKLKSLLLLLTWKRILEETSVKLILLASLKTPNYNSRLLWIFLNWHLMHLQISMSPVGANVFLRFQEVSTLAMELLAKQLLLTLLPQTVEDQLARWLQSRIHPCINLMQNNNFRGSLQALSKRKQEMHLSILPISERVSLLLWHIISKAH